MTTERVKHFETQAQHLRTIVGAELFGPIDPFDFATGLNAIVQYPDQIPGMSEEMLAGIMGIDAKSWSGGAQYLPDGRLQILLSRNQTPERRNVTILEELAHCHYGHETDIIGPDGRNRYDPVQEQEAYQTAAAILVPSKIVAMTVYKQESIEALGLKYGASRELLEMRIKVLGCWKDYCNAA
jgi:Zn-dependent peptidase ImmA (M78 family)